MRSTAWTDDRLDDLNHKVDRIDRRVDSLHRHMDARFDSIQRALFQAAIAMSASFLTGAAAIVATQL